MTDGGMLDKDDRLNQGPENVFWSNSSSAPPIGVYYVCFEPYSFNPSITISDPISATIKILHANQPDLIVTKNFTSDQTEHYECDSFSKTLLTSFTYS